MADTRTEFDWYSGEIDKVRRRCEHAWSEYSEARSQLNRLERERSALFSKLFREAALSAGQDK